MLAYVQLVPPTPSTTTVPEHVTVLTLTPTTHFSHVTVLRESVTVSPPGLVPAVKLTLTSAHWERMTVPPNLTLYVIMLTVDSSVTV